MNDDNVNYLVREPDYEQIRKLKNNAFKNALFLFLLGEIFFIFTKFWINMLWMVFCVHKYIDELRYIDQNNVKNFSPVASVDPIKGIAPGQPRDDVKSEEKKNVITGVTQEDLDELERIYKHSKIVYEDFRCKGYGDCSYYPVDQTKEELTILDLNKAGLNKYERYCLGLKKDEFLPYYVCKNVLTEQNIKDMGFEEITFNALLNGKFPKYWFIDADEDVPISYYKNMFCSLGRVNRLKMREDSYWYECYPGFRFRTSEAMLNIGKMITMGLSNEEIERRFKDESISTYVNEYPEIHCNWVDYCQMNMVYFWSNQKRLYESYYFKKYVDYYYLKDPAHRTALKYFHEEVRWNDLFRRIYIDDPERFGVVYSGPYIVAIPSSKFKAYIANTPAAHATIEFNRILYGTDYRMVSGYNPKF